MAGKLTQTVTRRVVTHPALQSEKAAHTHTQILPPVLSNTHCECVQPNVCVHTPHGIGGVYQLVFRLAALCLLIYNKHSQKVSLLIYLILTGIPLGRFWRTSEPCV